MPDPALFLHPRLRATYRIVEALTHNRLHCCYASLEYIARSRGKSTVTARRHIQQLVGLGVLRRRSIPGGIDHLFICPHHEWEVLPDCSENDRTDRSMGNGGSTYGDNKQRKGAEKPKGLPPVVIHSAKGSPQGEGMQAPLQDDTPDLAPFRAFIEQACGEEGENRQPNSLEVESRSVESPAFRDQNSPKTNVTILSRETPVSASLSVSPAPGPPAHLPSTSPTSTLTPEQTAILRQLLTAGVGQRQAHEMAQRDAQKANMCLIALEAALQRGQDIGSPGGWLWSAWNNEEFRYVERRQEKRGPVYAKDAGLVIAPPRSASAAALWVDPAADAARRAVVGRLRGGGMASV